MFCPVCDQVTLREVEKNGVNIDICPSCKGVWLDRGELEKLMKDVHEAHKEYDDLQSRVSQMRPSNDYDSRFESNQYAQRSYDEQSDYKKKQYSQYENSSSDGHSNIGYDKYGRPYKKKKKTVFTMLEDLFD